MQPHPLITFLVGLPLLVATSCGGGSRNEGAPPPGDPSLQLVIGTDTTDGSTITSVVHGVVVEDTDGRRIDALPETRVVTLADGLGRPEVLDLAGVPTGQYRSVHLLLTPGSTKAIRRDGSRTEVLVPGDRITMTASSAPTSKPLGRTLWTAALEGRVHLPSGTTVVWDPDFELEPENDVPVRHLEVEVMGIDPAAFIMDALLGSGTALGLRFPESAVLRDASSGTTVDRPTFFGLVEVGDRISVRGALDPEGTLVVQAASTIAGNTGDFAVLGRIESLDPSNEHFAMDVLAVKTGSPGLGGTTRVEVDAGTATIRYDGAPGSPNDLPFAALNTDDLVCVSWDTAFVQGQPIAAMEVLIQADGGPPLKGSVEQLDPGAGLVHLRPLAGIPMVLSGNRVRTATLKLTPNSTIYRRSPNRVIQPANVTSDDRIWAWGRDAGNGELRVFWARVQEDRRGGPPR